MDERGLKINSRQGKPSSIYYKMPRYIGFPSTSRIVVKVKIVEILGSFGTWARYVPILLTSITTQFARTYSSGIILIREV